MKRFCIILSAVLALIIWSQPARACPTVGFAGGYSQASFSQGFAGGTCGQQLLAAPMPVYGGCNAVGFAGGYNAVGLGGCNAGFVGVNRGFGFNLGVGFNRGFGRGFRSRTVIRSHGFGF